MKEISLTRGMVAFVDDADFETLSRFKWYVVKGGRTFYAARKIKREGGGRTVLYMHRLLTRSIKHVDHVDGNGLNNQRQNLRPCSRIQNGQNRKPQTHTSQFKGVSWRSDSRKWRACIQVDGQLLQLGSFSDQITAALAYNAAAQKHFVEFAKINVL